MTQGEGLYLLGNQKPMRIAITTSYGYWGGVSPSDLFLPGSPHQIGGGETACFWLSRALAAAGHTVDLFYDCARHGKSFGIQTYPKALKIPMLQSVDYDLLISWEDQEAVAINHRARKVIYAVQCNHLAMGVMDVGIDAYQCVSNWHVNFLQSVDPTVDKRKFFVIPNGVDLERYNTIGPETRRAFADPTDNPEVWPPDDGVDLFPPIEREPFRVYHSSSPDRGLHHLLDLWPRVKKRFPAATLHLYYDMQNWLSTVAAYTSRDHPIATEAVAGKVIAGLKKAEEAGGLTVHGGIGQWELAREQQKASLCVYPCSPIQPTEGFSISILEALAAGVPVITTDADALPELWGGYTDQLPLPIDPDDLFDRIVRHLTYANDDIISMGREYAETFDWRKVGARYVAAIERIVAE